MHKEENSKDKPKVTDTSFFTRNLRSKKKILKMKKIQKQGVKVDESKDII